MTETRHARRDGVRDQYAEHERETRPCAYQRRPLPHPPLSDCAGSINADERRDDTRDDHDDPEHAQRLGSARAGRRQEQRRSENEANRGGNVEAGRCQERAADGEESRRDYDDHRA